MEMKVAAIAVAMLATVLFPQPGYIHPDEFFQSVEIVAGDVFNISHTRAWEFNQSFPIRDITLPYLLISPGFYCLKLVMSIVDTFSLTVPASLVIIIPRLTMTVVGIVNFLLVRILAAESGVKRDDAVWIWATSYVTWVHLTRTFSNTVETVLFSAVCIVLSKTSNYLESTVTKMTRASEKTSPAGEDARKSAESFMSGTFSMYCLALGMLVCIGFFNRPTFLVFILVPLLWWAHFLFFSFRSRFVSAAVISATACVATFVCLTIVNTLYYNPQCSKLDSGQETVEAFGDDSGDTAAKFLQRAASDCLRIPPWNFFQYNMHSSNLAKHGIHPWYTHLLAGLPSLLGPLAVVLYWNLLKFAGCCWRCYRDDRSKIPVREGWLYLAIFVPILLLSVFPHQEPRFLLPIVPAAAVFAAKNSVTRGKTFTAVWLVFNVMAFIFFGWLHQGGLTPALSSFSSDLHKLKPDRGMSIHMIFYQTYMPPQHLLLASRGSANAVTVHDLASAHPVILQRAIKSIHVSSLKSRREHRLYLALPGSVVPDVSSIINEWTWLMMNKTTVTDFCPHLSTENLPTLRQLTSQLCLKVYVFTHFRLDDRDTSKPA